MRANWDISHEHDQLNISVAHPSPEFTIALTGTGDDDLSPQVWEASYVSMQTNSANAYNISYPFGSTSNKSPNGALEFLANGNIKVHRRGKLTISGYFDLYHDQNNATVGTTFVTRRDGVDYISSSAIHAKLPNTDHIGSLAGGGSADVLPGDELFVVVASDLTGTISIRSSTLQFMWVGI